MESGTDLKNSIYYAKRAILANQVMEYQYADAVKAFNVSAEEKKLWKQLFSEKE